MCLNILEKENHIKEKSFKKRSFKRNSLRGGAESALDIYKFIKGDDTLDRERFFDDKDIGINRDNWYLAEGMPDQEIIDTIMCAKAGDPSLKDNKLAKAIPGYLSKIHQYPVPRDFFGELDHPVEQDIASNFNKQSLSNIALTNKAGRDISRNPNVRRIVERRDWIERVQRNCRALSEAPDHIKNDKEIVIKAIDSGWAQLSGCDFDSFINVEVGLYRGLDLINEEEILNLIVNTIISRSRWEQIM